MRRLAGWCVEHRWVVIGAWATALVAVLVAARGAGPEYAGSFQLPRSDSQRAGDLLRERFPARGGGSATIVFDGGGRGLAGRAARARVEGVLARLRELPRVREAGSPYDVRGGGALAPHGRIGFGTLQFDRATNDLPREDVRRVIATARAGGPGLEVELAGGAIRQGEDSGSGHRGEAVGLMAAIVVLLVTFGSVVAMGLPVLTALFALGTGLGLVTLATHVFDVASFAPQLAAMIGLGVGIDYALFIVTRYRAALREGLSVPDAVVAALATSGRTVLFAGTIVVVALLGMLLLGVSIVFGLAVASALAVLLTMVASLTLLPALLAVLGRRIDALRPPRARRRAIRSGGGRAPGGPGADAGAAAAAGWVRWSRAIQRRPWPAAVGSSALLLVLCLPGLSLRLGASDAGSDPPATTSRRAYDKLAEGFGPGFSGPLLVVARLPDDDRTETVRTLVAALRGQDGVAAVAPPQLSPDGGAVLIATYPSTAPQSSRTSELIDRLRTGVVPRVAAATGALVFVGGSTAVTDDLAAALAARLPLFIGVVVLVAALLLMAVFRSLLVPVKAVLMNLLSIGAAFGVVVAIFQWGWLAEPLGVARTGPIEPFLPVMLFAIVFGLSMDYEVFLMTRIHEEWERRRDASDAVAAGLAATGRVITAAAAIMVAVFAAFALGNDRVIKLFGIGLASAVFLDAVVIRTLLVPAIMELLGARAWWLPAGLQRVLPRLTVAPPDVAAPRAVVRGRSAARAPGGSGARGTGRSRLG